MSRTFVIYVIDFDLIEISTCLTLLNDHQNLNFVKYIYVAGKKRPEIVVNWPYAKVVCFFGIQSLGRWGQKTEIRGDVLYGWPLSWIFNSKSYLNMEGFDLFAKILFLFFKREEDEI